MTPINVAARMMADTPPPSPTPEHERGTETAAVAKPAPYLKLYEATSEIDAAYELLVETEGEMTPEIEQLLAQAGENFDKKAERVALKVREVVVSADAVKVERDRLAARAKALENAAKSLRSYLCREMQRADRPKIKGELASIRVQDNQPAVIGADSLDEGALRGLAMTRPELVTIVPESFKLNAKALTDAWKKDGGTALAGLPTTVWVEVGAHVRIT